MSKILRMAMAAAATASAQNALAQESAPIEPIKVALIDVRPERIDGEDANLRMIDLTPAPPEGKMFTYAKTGGTNHGVIVATSFVREVRRIDKDVPIVIYTINPFVKTTRSGGDTFSMSTLRAGLDKLKQEGVKVAITTFSVTDKAGGIRIAEEFSKNGMILLAAAPNEPKDASIYPAALPGVIAIAEGKSGAAIHKDPSYKTFVRFVLDGYYIGRRAQTSGSSFATPKAAAYAAFMVRSDPTFDTTKVMSAFDEMGRSFSTLPEGVKRIGTDDMLEKIRNRYASTSRVASREDIASPVLMASVAGKDTGR